MWSDELVGGSHVPLVSRTRRCCPTARCTVAPLSSSVTVTVPALGVGVGRGLGLGAGELSRPGPTVAVPAVAVTTPAGEPPDDVAEAAAVGGADLAGDAR